MAHQMEQPVVDAEAKVSLPWAVVHQEGRQGQTAFNAHAHHCQVEGDDLQGVDGGR
jgi:hypothetical protein